MGRLYRVEVEPEVRARLTRLNDRDFGRVGFLVGLLAERAEDLGEPSARHLGGKVREPRFHLLAQQTRVTYWLAPGQVVSCPPRSARPAARKPRKLPAPDTPRRSAKRSTDPLTTPSTER
jgi:hypothetical protein